MFGGRMTGVFHPLAILPVILLAACQQQAAPLDEAKKVTASFEGQSFVPPPRTIADITAILDQQKPDPVKVEANRVAADALPPPGAPPAALSRFYSQRGLAATELGRTKQSLADFREAVRLGRDAGIDVSRALEALYRAEATLGNQKEALALAEELRSSLGDRAAQNLGALSAISRARLFLGDVAGAEQAINEAQDFFDTMRKRNRRDLFEDHWRSRIDQPRAELLRETGRYAEAERSIRLAIAEEERSIPRYDEMAKSSPNIFPRGLMERSVEIFRGELALILLRQNRLAEAEVEQRRALLNLLARYGRYSPEAGGAVARLALILQEEGRATDAEFLSKAAVDILENTGSGAGSFGLASALVGLAQAQSARNHWGEARATYDKLVSEVATDDAVRDRFLSRNINYGIVQIRTGSANEAVPIIQRAVDLRTRTLGERHYDTAEARGYLGIALLATKQRDRALAEFQAAVPILLQASRQVDDENGASARDRRLQFILEAYMNLLADMPGSQESAVESFHIADAARGQSVQRALAAASARTTVTDPALADLARREQDARKQIGALEGLLSNVLASPPDQHDAAGVQSLREQIDRLRTARAAAREEIEKRFPDYANLSDPRPATVERARAALRPGEALLATYVGATRTFVWALAKDGPVAFAAANLSQKDIDGAVKDLRRALDPDVATFGDIPAFDVATAHRLYAALLAPVAAVWQNAKSLLVVPHRALGQLPFALLVSEPTTVSPDAEGQALFANYKSVPFLIRKVAVTQLPSVAALVTLRTLPPADAKRKAFAGFGDPWFNAQEAAEARAEEAKPVQVAEAGLQIRGTRLLRRSAPATSRADSANLGQLPRLPDTAEEVRAIARALKADPAKDVFVGAQASESQVRTMILADRRVVMFATHGLVPGDLDGLTQPALALSAPSVTGGGGDGLLTMDKILGLKLDADWVVLSACNTAAGEGAGAEAVSGLGRAFFYAGARAVLVTNWSVETISARVLTTDTFRRQTADPTLSRAAALREAELALIDGPGAQDASGRTLFSYAHPIFWAPFSLVGDGGGPPAR